MAAVKRLLGISLSLLLTGCALMGGGTEIVRAHNYRLKPQASWKNTDRAESDAAYRTKEGNVVTVTSSCNRNPDAPLETLTRHLLIGTRNVNYLDQRRRRVNGVDGLYSKVKATADGTPIYLDLFVLVKEKCVFDFSLLGPKPLSDAEEKDFLTFVDTFSYGKN